MIISRFRNAVLLPALVAIFSAILIILGSCSLALTDVSNKDSNKDSDSAHGSLVIRVGQLDTARALVPSQNLDVSSFTISGTGPGNATFTLDNLPASTTSTSRQYLAVGAWTITAVAKNDQGTVLASGTKMITIVTAIENTVSIDLTSLTGNGTVSLNATWPAGIVTSPVVSATLTPLTGGSDLNLNVTIGADKLSATLAGPTIPAGSYTLTVILKDGTNEVGRGVDGVVVAKSMSTTGTLQFLYDVSIGALAIDLKVGLTNPIPLTATAGLSVLELGATTSITANSAVTGISEYRWFVNGIRDLTVSGNTYPFGNGRSVGTYRIDVMAFRADRVGSASTVLQVIRTRTAPVIFSPAAGSVDTGTTLTMTSVTSGAQIRYTTDGSEPSDTSSLYNPGNKPIVNITSTFKAKAFADSFSDSLTTVSPYTALGPTDVVYVSTTGADTNQGTAAAPKLTILAALEYAQANNVPEVRVAAGTYKIEAKYGVPITKTINLKGGYNATNWNDRQYLTETDRNNVNYATILKYDYPFNGTTIDDSTRVLDIYDINLTDGQEVKPLVEGFSIVPKSVNSAVATTSICVHSQAFPIIRNTSLSESILSGIANLVRVTDSSVEIDSCNFSGPSSINGIVDIAFINTNVQTQMLNVHDSSFSRSIDVSGNNIIGGSTKTSFSIKRNQFIPDGVIQATDSPGKSISLMGFGSIESNTFIATGNTLLHYGTPVYTFYEAINIGDADNQPLSISRNNIRYFDITPAEDCNFNDGNSWGRLISGALIHTGINQKNTSIIGNSISFNRLGTLAKSWYWNDGSSGTAGVVWAPTEVRSITQNVITAIVPTVSSSFTDVIAISSYGGDILGNTIAISTSVNSKLYGIYCLGNVSIRNNLVNLASPDKNDIGINDAGGNPLELSNNLFYMDPGPTGAYYYDNQGGYGAINDINFVNLYDATTQSSTKPSSGNIALNPATTTIFADAVNGNYHIDLTAPASVRNGGIDLGSLAFWPTNVGGQPVDIEGTVRTIPWTIGAYERD